MNNFTKQDIGRLAESKLAKRLGGRCTVLSGGGNIQDKGDISTNERLIEVKSTTRNSIKIPLDWLRKITAEANDVAKTPALAVQFVNYSGEPVRNGSWIMIPEYSFKDLMDSD